MHTKIIPASLMNNVAVANANELSEDSLVQMAIKRDRAAFTTLYELYVGPVYRHVYFRVSNQADAEDITQEVFVRAWKAISKYRQTGAPFLSWLLVIARNLVTDYYKSHSKKDLPLEWAETVRNGLDTAPESITEANFNRAHVNDAISRLNEGKKKVVTMRFLQGFSYREIAHLLNKSEGAVRVLLHRALSDLRHILTRG